MNNSLKVCDNQECVSEGTIHFKILSNDTHMSSISKLEYSESKRTIEQLFNVRTNVLEELIESVKPLSSE